MAKSEQDSSEPIREKSVKLYHTIVQFKMPLLLLCLGPFFELGSFANVSIHQPAQFGYSKHCYSLHIYALS